MRKLPFILFGAIAAVVSIGVGQGCGDSSTNTGGSGPGGGNSGGSNAGGATTQGNGGSTSTTTPGNGGSSATVNPTSSGGSSPGTGGSAGAGGGGGASACSGDTPVSLTIVDYQAWCKVKVGNGSYVVGSNQTVCVGANADVDLAAQAKNDTFEVIAGIWHGTDDDGAAPTGNPPTVSTTIQVGANGSKCAWVCCPFQGGSGCDNPPQDPCQGQ